VSISDISLLLSGRYTVSLEVFCCWNFFYSE